MSLSEKPMQETRQHILEILKENGHATVDDIVSELRKRRGNITAVTVRHHLAVLQQDNLITTPELRHRSTPGRPQHVYALTEKAREHFPNNYQHLAANLLKQIATHVSPEGVNVILEGVAENMATEAKVGALPLRERLVMAVDYLNDHGYNASWEEVDEGFILHTYNCPYHHVAHSTDALCSMDMRLIASLLGTVPRLVSRVSSGDESCTYMIPYQPESE
jgi:predicted ArsR family transcriptional regulator